MLLEAKKLDKTFNGVYALKGLDLSLKEGEIHGLVGENGAGKSTFIKILGGVYTKNGVTLYAETEKPIRTIAEECGESESALRAYLRRYWRELMLRRHGIEAEGKEAQEFSFYTPEGQSCLAHKKYKDAVVACDSIQYIDLNVIFIRTWVRHILM